MEFTGKCKHAWDDFSVADAQGEEHWPFESEEYVQLFASYGFVLWAEIGTPIRRFEDSN